MRLRLALVIGGHALEAGCDALDELGRGERRGQAVEADQPARELLRVGDRRGVEQRAVVAVLERAVLADGALDQPGRLGLDQDRGLPVAVPQLPGGAVAVGARVELGRTRKSRSRRVAKRTSPRMRSSLKVRTSSRSWSRPITYQ